MLSIALMFFILALIAAIFGFTTIAVAAVSIAQILFIIFVIGFVFSILVHVFRKGEQILTWALLFFIFAIIAGIFGFTGIAIIAASIAKILFIIFIIAFILSLVAHLFKNNNINKKQ